MTLLDRLDKRAPDCQILSFEELLLIIDTLNELQKALLAILPAKKGVDRSQLADEIAAIIRGATTPAVEPPADDDSSDDTPEA